MRAILVLLLALGCAPERVRLAAGPCVPDVECLRFERGGDGGVIFCERDDAGTVHRVCVLQ